MVSCPSFSPITFNGGLYGKEKWFRIIDWRKLLFIRVCQQHGCISRTCILIEIPYLQQEKAYIQARDMHGLAWFCYFILFFSADSDRAWQRLHSFLTVPDWQFSFLFIFCKYNSSNIVYFLNRIFKNSFWSNKWQRNDFNLYI